MKLEPVVVGQEVDSIQVPSERRDRTKNKKKKSFPSKEQMLRIAELVNIQEDRSIEEKINKQAEKTAKLLHKQGEAAERKSKKQLKLVKNSLFQEKAKEILKKKQSGSEKRNLGSSTKKTRKVSFK